MYYTTCPSPIGELTLACGAGGDSLAGLWISGQKYHGMTLFQGMKKRDDMPVFDAAKSWLAGYFAGQKPDPSQLPLAPSGSAFRQRVWQILCQIPYGTVTTYGEIARMLSANTGVDAQFGLQQKSYQGELLSADTASADVQFDFPQSSYQVKTFSVATGGGAQSARAVGGAVGHNPISIIIPCHRVVGADGSLTGFSAGIAAKLTLLELEGTDLSPITLPKQGTAL